MKRVLLAALVAAAAVVLPARAVVTTTTNSVTCTAPGGAMVCNLPFPFKNNSDLVVTLNGSLKVIGTDYTVACAGCTSGGSVTMVANPTQGQSLVVSRVLPLTQTFSARSQGPFRPASYENAFDTLEMQIQQIGSGTGGTGTLTVSSPLTGLGSVAAPLGCQTASGSQPGCLSAADWTTFNNKSSGGASTSTANTWTALQTVTPVGPNSIAITANGVGTGVGIAAFGGGGGSGQDAIQGTGNGAGSGVNGQGGALGAGGTFTGGATGAGGPGVFAIGGAGTAAAGLRATGAGTGAGVSATGGANTGTGVLGTGGAPNGEGVVGVGVGTGYGVEGDGAAGASGGAGGLFTAGGGVAPTRGAINLTPQPGPISPADGDVWVETGTNTLKSKISGTVQTVYPQAGGVTLSGLNTWTAVQTITPSAPNSDALRLTAAGTGIALTANASASGNKDAIQATGNGAGHGITATGGALGVGGYFTGGATGAGSGGVTAIAGAGTAAAGLTAVGAGTGNGATGTGGSNSGTGVTGIGGATNGLGISGQGTGTGAGVQGVGGSTGTTGPSAGGVFSSTATNGWGVYANGSGTGPGGDFAGGASAPGINVQAGGGVSPVRGAIAFASQNTPTTPVNGDVWYDGVTFRARVGGSSVSFIGDTSWTAVTPGTGVTNVGAPYFNLGVFKDNGGFVHLRGRITTVNANPSTLAVLPTGYRPTATMTFVYATNGVTIGSATIDSTGTITQTLGNLTNVALDGLVFDTR